ncbi:VCBS repeat-containing protein [Devosia sp. FKR38]|uniref:FG-GAP repeat domain-containing protein n=1 Tax=Devosia sp. FKR38 TaxID=2562312 RepID=UPI0010C05A1B|nr:VCBS repeat-containing protein [Devosia sp. FKR38]
MKAHQALAFAILLAGPTVGPALGQSSSQADLIAGLGGINGPAGFEQASSDIKAAGAALGTLLPDLVAVNANLYVYLVQQGLVDQGLRRAGPTGLLTADTITQINALCAKGGIQTLCSAGPLTPAAAGPIGQLLDGAAPIATAAITAPAEPVGKSKPAASTPPESLSVAALLGGPAADLDGDGAPDTLLRAGDWLYLAKPDGSTVDIGSVAGMSVVGLGDVDGDGLADVVLRRDDSAWLFALSLKAGALDLGKAGDSQPLAVGKFEGNGAAQVLLQRPSGWLYALGTGKALSLGDYNGLKLVAVEDHDKDGIDDLLLETASGWRAYRLSTAPGTLTPA